MYKRINQWIELGKRDMAWLLIWRLGWCTDEEYDLALMYDVISLDHVKGDVISQGTE